MHERALKPAHHDVSNPYTLPVVAPDRVAELEAEVARLREALEWYADPQIYRPHPHGLTFAGRRTLDQDRESGS